MLITFREIFAKKVEKALIIKKKDFSPFIGEISFTFNILKLFQF